MSTPDNPYEIFLGIKTDPKKPDLARVFEIDLKSTSEEEIKIATDRVIAAVRSKKPGQKRKEWAWLIDQLKKAQQLLLSKSQASTPAGKVGTYAPPASAAKSKATTNETASPKPAARNPAANNKSVERSKKRDNARASAGKDNKDENDTSSVALPPTYSKAKKNSPAKAQPDSVDKKSKSEGANPFALDAPDENDSFDSDTQFSAGAFNSAGATAHSIDPMAAVADPTEGWSSFDVGQIDEYGLIGGATAVATRRQMASSTQTDSATGKTPVPITDRTFYGESYRKKSNVGMMVGGTLLAMLIVGGISYAVIFGWNPKNGDNVAQGDSGDNSKNDSSNNNSTDNGSKDTEKKKQDDDNNSAGVNTKKADDTKQDDTDPAKNTDDGNDQNKDENKKSDPEMKPKGDDEDKKEEKKSEPDNPGNTAPTDPKKSADDSEIKKKEPEPKAPKNSDIAQLANLLPEIRTKLNERNFVDASRLIAKAQELPVLPDHKLLLDRLVQVNDHYQEFWNKVVEGCGKLKALDEIKFSETNIVKIVESSEERIVYRALGQRFEKEPRELQVGLAMKIAEKEMDMLSAEGRIIKGSVFAIEGSTNPDRKEEARQIWEEAKLVGAETDELLLFLDDTYEDLLASVITREKVPEEDAVKAAQERFREKYADQQKAAGRNQKAADEFAAQLLKDVPSLDDAADRHANFVAATYYAGKNGNIELLMTALSDMNKWFSIDLDQETFDALTKTNKNRLKPEQKKEIARTAFEYMDRAKAAGNSELELQYAELALAAAKGARDQKLVQTATREVQRIKAAMDANNSNNSN